MNQLNVRSMERGAWNDIYIRNVFMSNIEPFIGESDINSSSFTSPKSILASVIDLFIGKPSLTKSK